MRQLDYVRRWFGTAISFFLFGVGGLFQGIVIHPLIWLTVRNVERRQRLSRRVVGFSMLLFVNVMKVAGVYDYEISGMENARKDESYLILANHPTLIDVIVLLSVFPDANCVVKDSVARNPLFFVLMKSAGYISNSDPVSMMCESLESLEAGSSLVIFPEGTRTQNGALPSFVQGAAAIAVRSRSRCLPVVISCVPHTLSGREHWYQIPDRKVRYTAAIQPPLDIAPIVDAAADSRAATVAVNQHLQDYFLASLEAPAEVPSQAA